MKDRFLRIANKEKLTRAAHATVFGTGLLSLTISISASAASAF
ncbi:hypothetical protein OEZ60_13740 [Defluviimonas sp. WL0024]|uniref:Uncharacterized protein n=2 Tax=Albidovulum TaxID=205889 RepID=A0ABT3J569_9RHOB|nr:MULTISPECIES: hypothetical protein [Defluviimonas]MCU9849065.1 hypothetical protein [Defluviimonas sp. WL0024]MCW3782808.1 hypothetical protein [Defluviimonas salinarum]